MWAMYGRTKRFPAEKRRFPAGLGVARCGWAERQAIGRGEREGATRKERCRGRDGWPRPVVR